MFVLPCATVDNDDTALAKSDIVVGPNLTWHTHFASKMSRWTCSLRHPADFRIPRSRYSHLDKLLPTPRWRRQQFLSTIPHCTFVTNLCSIQFKPHSQWEIQSIIRVLRAPSTTILVNSKALNIFITFPQSAWLYAMRECIVCSYTNRSHVAACSRSL